jgi:hypothetical protein
VTWKGYRRKQHPSIYLEKLEKTTKIPARIIYNISNSYVCCGGETYTPNNYPVIYLLNLAERDRQNNIVSIIFITKFG